MLAIGAKTCLSSTPLSTYKLDRSHMKVVIVENGELESSVAAQPDKRTWIHGHVSSCGHDYADQIQVLGGSLHDVLTRLKAQPHIYPVIDVSYSSKEPLVAPITLNLPRNGFRLRFDGPDQRLRLIEILDFTRTHVTYKNVDLVKLPESTEPSSFDSISPTPTGPAFRQIYHKLFGPTFAGEYFPPTHASGQSFGTYVLSYPGVAFSFFVLDSMWSSSTDFVTILSSSSTQAAKSLAIFNGTSWRDVRSELYTRPCPHPRTLALSSRGRESSSAEIDLVKICGHGRIEMLRRSLPPFQLILGETTPQDLVTELGPPDAIYRKSDRRLSIHKARTTSHSSARPQYGSPGQLDGFSDTDHSSVNTVTSDSEHSDATTFPESTGIPNECFYNYFQHGMDIFISSPSTPSPALVPTPEAHAGSSNSSCTSSAPLTATKVLLHANVPGSYAFNRYRRSRWQLDPAQVRAYDTSPLTSETSFSTLATSLRSIWRESFESEEDEQAQGRPMVLNRGWGDSPGSSCELLGGWEEHKAERTKGAGVSGGNTELFGFPGLLVEVLKSGAVSCLTVY